jgi:hypothetical protein
VQGQTLMAAPCVGSCPRPLRPGAPRSPTDGQHLELGGHQVEYHAKRALEIAAGVGPAGQCKRLGAAAAPWIVVAFPSPLVRRG